MTTSQQELNFTGSFNPNVYNAIYNMNDEENIMINSVDDIENKIKEELKKRKNKYLDIVYDYLLLILDKYGIKVNVKFIGYEGDVPSYSNYNNRISLHEGNFRLGPFATYDPIKMNTLFDKIIKVFYQLHIFTCTSYNHYCFSKYNRVIDCIAITITYVHKVNKIMKQINDVKTAILEIVQGNKIIITRNIFEDSLSNYNYFREEEKRNFTYYLKL